MIQSSDPLLVKKQVRAERAAVRRAVCAATGPVAAVALAALAPCLGVAAGTVVAGYWPMGDEIDPRPLMAALAQGGGVLALPEVVARAQPLRFRRWSAGEALEGGAHGTFHPMATAPEVVPQLLLVPLLAFDRAGYRLGYGGGYYDRTLESLRENVQLRAIGVAFAAQEMAAVPRDGHDQRLDAIATERELITPETA